MSETATGRRPSRYPEPGSLSGAWWEDADNGYALVQAQVAVMATSRHQRFIDKAAAEALLRDHYGDDLAGIWRIGFWRSVTQTDIEMGLCGDSDRGDWNENGTGAAWVKVAYPHLVESGTNGSTSDGAS